ITPEQLTTHDADLARILAAYGGGLDEAGLADRAAWLAAACDAVEVATPPHLLALDVALSHPAEATFLRAVCAAASNACACLPVGDQPSLAAFQQAFGDAREERTLEPAETHDLARLQRRLFAPASSAARLDEAARVTIASSPGEGRESVEVARGILAAAARGVRFDRIAVVVRAVENYRVVLEEALARADIPAHFAEGVRRPAAVGRAFCALLACASDGLSARRFAEYLSLGVAADGGDEGGDSTESFVSPRRWERLLVEASVVGGRERWTRRLRGLARSLDTLIGSLDPDDPRRDSHQRELERLAQLERFAFPILDALQSLPHGRSWGEWLRALDALARLSLDAPDSVCEMLAELAPLAPIGPVSLETVQRILSPRLRSVIVRSSGHGAGRVFVGSLDDIRGRSFDSVFVLGIAEKVFPARIAEDPLLPDRVRRALTPSPRTIADRVAAERLYLRLAIGAATEHAVLSFPRFDQEHNRPRVPSFYGLEVLQAIHGVLPAFDELTRRAELGAAARMGWPAPKDPAQAIDAAEYDLAILDRWLSGGDARIGAARYLLNANQHLARALRFRFRRWQSPRFNTADGFIVHDPIARDLLATHALTARAYSATSLALFESCPYKFYLHAIARVAPREDASEVAELDPRQRGELFHAIQRDLIEQLVGRSLLPIDDANFEDVRALLQRAIDRAIAEAREIYAPAIERVFDDALHTLQADLHAWLSGMRAERIWSPTHAELPIEKVALEVGLVIAGAIDLIERQVGSDDERPVLRATDHKTGAFPERLGIVSGGKVLQPLLYALALERIVPNAEVRAGRLYFCTARGDFETHEVALDDRARSIARRFLGLVSEMLAEGFLPAAPSVGACERCSYRVVCGPYEEERVERIKGPDALRLRRLQELRGLP
ncbi:MAG TPA: PD-(D/E)XK nuclease family protein, partial [Polyangiales bacterium]|nr:PD-(D/E)XK nuclease family protein [Polyangiales bacterium]